VKERVSSWLITLPTCGSNIEQMIAERERVVSQLAMEGTHQGTWMGIFADWQKITYPHDHHTESQTTMKLSARFTGKMVMVMVRMMRLVIGRGKGILA
jgi:predicted ester cyclase